MSLKKYVFLTAAAACAFAATATAGEPVGSGVPRPARQSPDEGIFSSLKADANGLLSDGDCLAAMAELNRRASQTSSYKDMSLVFSEISKFWINFPQEITLADKNSPEGKAKIFINPENGRFIIGPASAFPKRISNPKASPADSLPSAYKLKRTFDRDRDGALSDDEIVALMVEMRYAFAEAKNGTDRAKIVARCAEALADLRQEEFEASWGSGSSFKIVKNSVTGVWEAPEEPPAPRFAFGAHPSGNFAGELLKKDPGGLALREFCDELQRINPFLRADKIAELLPEYMAKSYPEKGSDEWEERNAKIGYATSAAMSNFRSPDITGLIEYVNERHEAVTVPLFFTDPQGTAGAITQFSELNQSRLSPEEAEELQAYAAAKESEVRQ